MPDETIEYQIKTTADVAGQKQTVQANQQVAASAKAVGGEIKDRLNPAVENYKESTKRAAGATSELTARKTDLKKMVRELGQEFPILGLAGRLAINPLVGLVTVLMAAMAGLKSAFDRIITASNTGIFAGSFRASLEQTTKQVTDSQVAWNAFLQTLEGVATAQETIVTNARQAIAALRQEHVALTEQTNAEKARDLARINLQEAQGKLNAPEAIRARMELESRYARKAYQETIAAREEELTSKRKEQSEFERGAGVAEREAATARAAADEADSRLAQYKALVEGTKKALGETEKQIKALQGVTLIGPGHYAQLHSAEALRGQLKASLWRLEPQAADVETAAALARKRYEESKGSAAQLRGSATKLAGEITAEQALADSSYIAAGGTMRTGMDTRLLSAAAETARGASQIRTEVESAMATGNAVKADTLRLLRDWTAGERRLAAALHELDSRVGSLENGRAMHPPGTH